MSRPPQRELNLPGFLVTPFIQTAFVLAFNAAGTSMGQEVLRLTHWNFANVTESECQRISSASMAVSTGFMTLCLAAGTLLFSPNKPVARYNNAFSNSAMIAGTTPFAALLSPILGGYFMFGLPLINAAFIGTSAFIGVSAIAVCLSLMLGMGKLVNNCCVPPYNPADEKTETTDAAKPEQPTPTVAAKHAKKPQPLAAAVNPMDINTRVINISSDQRALGDETSPRSPYVEEPAFHPSGRNHGHTHRLSEDFRYPCSQVAFYSRRKGHQRRTSIIGSDGLAPLPHVPAWETGHRRVRSA